MRAAVLRVEGSGPDLVYVPGLDGTGEFLFGTANKLREHFRLIQLYYEPDSGPPQPSLEELAESVLSSVREIGAQHPLVLAESFGGPVAMSAALAGPGQFRGMCIVNSFARFPHRARLAFSRFTGRFLPMQLFALFRPVIARRAFFGRLCEEAALREFIEREQLTFGPDYLWRLELIARLDLRSRVSELTLPIALHAAERDRVVPSVQCASELHALLADSTMEIIPDGGHVVLPLESLPWLEWLFALDARCR